MDVHLQLAICLCRLGRYGNGAAVEEIAEWAGYSTGTVYNCTYRCEVALHGLHDENIKFHDPEQLHGAKSYVAGKGSGSAWAHGAMAVDGTPIKLFSRPSWFGRWFYGKDKIYALQLTVRIQAHSDTL